jgi:S1-C subfamily serine protease
MSDQTSTFTLRATNQPGKIFRGLQGSLRALSGWLGILLSVSGGQPNEGPWPSDPTLTDPTLTDLTPGDPTQTDLPAFHQAEGGGAFGPWSQSTPAGDSWPQPTQQSTQQPAHLPLAPPPPFAGGWHSGGSAPWDAGPVPAGPPPPRRQRPVMILVGLAVVVAAASLGVRIGVALADRRIASRPANSNSTFSLPSPGPKSTNPPTVSAIAAQVDPAVVDVTSTLSLQGGAAAGTGMVITSSGEVLTNNHVVNGATKVTVQIDGQGRSYTANVVGTDVADDVALLQMVGASGLKTIKLGDSSKVAVGDPVVAIGNALNLKGPPSVTEGTVTALDQSITASDPGGSPENLVGMIESNTPLRPGDSGGPLVNTSGEVVGMDTAASGGRRFRSAAGAAFAVPINKAKSIADAIHAGHGSAQIRIGLPGLLGVEVAGDNSGVGGANGNGAVLSGVAPNSPAQAAGLVAGDTITSFDGKAVSTPSDLTRLIGARHPGDSVPVIWVDQSGHRHNATIRLATGPAD